MEIKKSTFDKKPQLVTIEGKDVMVCFDVTERTETVENMDGKTSDDSEDETKEQATKTVYDCYSVRVQQPISRDKVVDTIVSTAYPSDRMQAIVNNHFLNLATLADGNELDDDDKEHEAEYEAMQAWRKQAKETAKDVITEYMNQL